MLDDEVVKNLSEVSRQFFLTNSEKIIEPLRSSDKPLTLSLEEFNQISIALKMLKS